MVGGVVLHPGVYRDAASLVFNFVAANAIILSNKQVFVGAQFKFPGTLTLIHYVFTWACGLGLLKANVFTPKKVDTSSKKALWFLIVVWSLANVVSNSSLEKNSIGFYQMMKILVTPLVVVIEWVMYGKTISWQRSSALLVTSAGVALATVSDIRFNWSGACTSLLAIILGALHKVMTSHVQQNWGFSSLQLMHYGLPRMIAILAVTLPFFDPPGMSEYTWSGYRLAAVLGSGMVGFLINYSMTLALGRTSALTIVLLGQFKTVSVLLFGALLFDGTPSARSVVGATIAVAAITTYTLLNLRERQMAKRLAKKSEGDLVSAKC
mmetsp:Transcript_832/g.1745  ORF Transcript_832/g.1745 Transcript_832/m.1745 type:complete len:323 (-) Transcript_832:341-1309(-)|eukprot:CAMPEP_0118923798 /NCGR_PEP_ID=MMETSP1169-20130426/2191_1 /TAXON_ID=36882 /ORGANISM="Pyramimonas obovata, Strain CCMP722" /LENGTH=322 /DNA_ID=CAMNT_0006864847 /DNA_START=319 /DNA_END=1287 /DNA_ORIENTATION=+